MAMLEFTLTPDGCGKVYDALVCLAKFSDTVAIEALPSQLALTALNTSKSAYVCFTLDKNFFAGYTFSSSANNRDDRFSCQILNKALLAVFRGRAVDPRQRESGLDRCEVSVDDRPGQAKCRFNIKMIARHGVTKTYSLTYESIETMRALFDKSRASNTWRIHAKHLREYIEFFAPKTEQLDIYAEEGKCTFLAFTEKITHGKEVLKQPLQTAISIEVSDFQEFKVVDDLHVVINVKDFKNMAVHAETLKTVVTALYSQPSRPLRFEYSAEGMRCEFTLMTIGEAPSIEPQSLSRAATRAPPSRPVSESEPARSTRSRTDMPPPAKPAQTNTSEAPRLGRRTATDTSQQQPSQSSQGLFVTDDDDHQWEPTEEREDEEEMLGWDASGDNGVPLGGTFRDVERASGPAFGNEGFDDSGIAPTQRASQIRGLFD